MDLFIRILINGITQGVIYALMALGYSVIVGITGLVTFVHGDVIMVGAFAAYFAFSIVGSNVLIGIVSAFIAAGLLGILVYKICYERFLNMPRHIALVCTIGMSMVIKNMAQIIFGPNQKPMINIIENSFYEFGPIQISLMQVYILLTVIVLSLALSFFFNKTKYGIAMRAVAQDKTAANLMGIDVKKSALLGNVIGCGLAGVAGVLLSLYYQTLQATMGGPLGMKAFSASVLGGLTDTRFSSLGGLIIGLIENLGIYFSASSYRDIFAFVFLITMLIIKPTGFKTKKGTRP